MPSLSNHQSNQYTKLLVMGDSKAGKTGALASLVKAGYKLRILDFDNGLDVLKNFVLRDCPENIDNIEYRTLRDEHKANAGGITISGGAKAFVNSYKMLDHWKYKIGDEEIDYGDPSEWGPDVILVIDSLTFMSDAAFDWAEPLVPTGRSGDRDARAVYKMAQDAISDMLATITSESFHTNVIVISHVKYIERQDGTTKGYPTSVGSALSPEIPRYFNSVTLFETSAGGKRTLKTISTAMIDLANPKPFDMGKEYPIETGLADFFGILRESPKTQPKLRKIK